MGIQKAIAAAVLAMGAAVLGACGGEVAASGNVTRGAASEDAVKLVARDNEFGPEEITGKAGEQVTVQVTNEGDAAHNFVIEQMNVSSGTLKSDEIATVKFVMPDSVTEFVCSFHGGMKGELVPEEA